MKKEFSRWQFIQLMFGWPFAIMVGLVFIEAVLSACVTYFVIHAGRDIVNNDFVARDFLWILFAQTGSYLTHAISWIFGERAGFHAFARYMMIFTRENRHKATVLGARDVRETAEPFLTNETFHLLFETMYELEGTLQLAFGLILNVLVIGFEIDGGFPIAYAVILVIVLALQFSARKLVANAYLTNQRATNRMTAQTYTAWDNIFSGNRSNFGLWNKTFLERLQIALKAQIHAILVRETLSGISGVIGLIIIFATMAFVVQKDVGQTALLVAMAATLPKQISLTHDIHAFAIAWNDLLALWTRAGGVVEHMHLERPEQFDQRIKFDRITLKQGDTQMQCSNLADALAMVNLHATGLVQVRGGNGSGKSSLLAALKESLKGQAYYWPTTDRLAFEFAGGTAKVPEAENEEDDDEPKASDGFSSGERQLKSLQEIVQKTNNAVYLFDEWDANLDPMHRAKAAALVDQLAARARVIEISHRG